MKRILALDMGSTTGWAYQDGEGRVMTGTQVCLKSLVPGARWTRFLEWLEFSFDQADLIVFEEPFIHMKHRKGIGVSYGFKTTLELFAAKHDIRCYGVEPTVLKKWATGHGNATKTQMLVFARSMNWDLSDDNEVDARWLLHYAQERIVKLKGAA